MKQAFIDFHTCEKNFFSMVSFTQTNYDNLSSFTTGVNAANLNPVIVHQINDSFSANLKLVRSFYSEKKLPWVLLLPEYYYNDSVDKLVQQQGLVFSDKGVAMSLLLENNQLPSNDSPLTIVKMDDKLHDWSIPLLHGFESTTEITEIYRIRHQEASEKSDMFYHFSGFINNNIVCSLSLSFCAHNARLDDIATIPSYQGKGYATALIITALKYAQQLKAKHCFLEASSSGLSLYKKLGFNELFSNHYYEIP